MTNNKNNNNSKPGVILDFGHDKEGLKIIISAFHESLNKELVNLEKAIKDNDRKYANAILHKLKPNLKYFKAPETDEFYIIESKLKDLDLPQDVFNELTSRAEEIIKNSIKYLKKTFISV